MTAASPNHTAARPAAARLRLVEWALPLLAALVLTGVFLVDSWQSYRALLADARLALAGYARTAAAATQSEIMRVDLGLADMERHIAEAGPLSPPQLARLAGELVRRQSSIALRRPAVVFATPDGRILASSQAPLLGLSLSEQAAFKEQITGARRLTVSALPAHGPLPAGALLARAVRADDGALRGVAAVIVSREIVDGVMRTIAPPDNVALRLLDHQGQLIAATPALREGSLDGLGAALAHHLAGSGASSTQQIPAAADAAPRLVAFDNLPDFGLVIAIERDTDALLAPWYRSNAVRWALLATMLGLGLWFSLQSRRRQQTNLADKQRFEALIENSEDVMAIIAADGVLIWISPSVTRLTGYRPDQVTGQHFVRSVHRDDQPAMELMLHRLQDNPDARLPFYAHVHSPRKGWIPVEGLASAHFANPAIGGAVVTFRDVSEREQKTLALRQSEQMLNQAQSIGGMGSWRFDAVKRVYRYSDEACRIMGLRDKSELTPDDMRVLIHPDDLATVEAAWAAATKGEEYDIGHRVIVDGEPRWLHSRANMYFDDFGKFTIAIGTIQDVTAQKLAADHLAELLAFNEKIIAESSIGIAVLRGDGGVVLINEALARMVGGTRAALQRLDYRSMESWQANGTLAAADRALASGQPVRHLVNGISHFGRQINLDLEFVPMNWQGQPHLLLLVKDYSEFHAAEEALRQGQRLAEEANRAKSEFLANMSHEIRTPLNAVIGLAQLSLDRSSDPTLREYQTQLVQSANALLEIINDILDYSKIEAGRLTLDAHEFGVRDITARVIGMFRQSAGAKGLELQTEIADDVPARVYGDPVRIGQIVINLVANAIKFTESGSVRLEIRRSEADRRRPASADLGGEAQTRPVELSFVVSDTGIGMNEEVLANLFRPFMQADGSITRRYGGTGLGLTISRRLAELMGGDIAVASVIDQGSTFTLTLPLAYRPQTVSTPSGQASVASLHDPTRIVERARTIAGAHVLVVEDERVNQMVIDRLLQRAGLKVTLARHGGEALAMLEKAAAGALPAIDAILMDLQMPVMDGFAATRAIRADGRWNDLPIIAVTAAVLVHDEATCREVGMTGFVAKPVQPAVLIDLLVAQLGPRRPALAVPEEAATVAPEIAVPSASERREQLLQLQAKLAAHEFIAVGELSALRTLFGAAGDARAERLQAAISRYDYAQAQHILAELIDHPDLPATDFPAA